MLPINTLLNNRYRIIRQLGQGGMGAVYEAMDEHVNCLVAVKENTLDAQSHLLAETKENARDAFTREAQLLANLSHPSLPKVHDYFVRGAAQFFVMQHISGTDLEKLLEQRARPFPVKQVLAWADDLLDALAELHAYDPPIVHRDIKPGNLKLTPKKRIMLLDFGLAKGAAGVMTAVDPQHGYTKFKGFTFFYSSPEQMRGLPTDPRSDLYSLAATLWHLLTAQFPPDAMARAAELGYKNPDPLTPAHAHNPEVPTEVSAVLTQALSLDAGQRPAHAQEMRQLLRDAANAEPQRQTVAAQQAQAIAEQQRQAALDQALRRVAQAESQLQAAQAENQRLHNASQQLRADAEHLQQTIAQQQADNASLRQQAEVFYVQEVKQLHQELAVTKHRLRESGSELVSLRHQADEARQLRQKLAETQEQYKQRLQESQAEIHALHEQTRAAEAQIQKLQQLQTRPAQPYPLAPTMLPPSVGAPKPNRLWMLATLPALALGLLLGVGGMSLRGNNAPDDNSNQVKAQTASSPDAAPPSAKQPDNAPPPGMSYIPGGAFQMGRDDGDEYERPAHQVVVKPFYLDIYEVTQADYKKCVEADKCRAPASWENGAYPTGTDKWPVTGVTWDAANGYAKWAGKRLPNEAEWEFAARGLDGRLYPWGNEWKPDKANATGARNEFTDVGTFPAGASPYGAQDLSGNAWEWTADRLTAYPGGKSVPNRSAYRIIRGGSFIESDQQATATYRGFLEADSPKNDKTGFRCAQEIQP